MKGLLLKDFINLKSQWKIIGIFIIFYGVMAATVEGMAATYSFMLVFLAFMLPLTAMSYDESCGWDKYALSMPVSRRDIVAGKYLLSLVLGGTALLINLLFSIFISAAPIGEALMNLALYAGILFLLSAILLPFVFRLGVEKARIAMIAAVLLPVLVILLAYQMDVSLPGYQALRPYIAAAPFASLAVYGGSFAVSLRVYARKEL